MLLAASPNARHDPTLRAPLSLSMLLVVSPISPASVSLLPRGGAVGDVLVGVQLVDWDGYCALAAVFVVDVAGVGNVGVGFGGAVAVFPRFGAGHDPSGALGAHESDGSVWEFGDGHPPVFGTVRVPFLPGFSGQVVQVGCAIFRVAMLGRRFRSGGVGFVCFSRGLPRRIPWSFSVFWCSPWRR